MKRRKLRNQKTREEGGDSAKGWGWEVKKKKPLFQEEKPKKEHDIGRETGELLSLRKFKGHLLK